MYSIHNIVYKLLSMFKYTVQCTLFVVKYTLHSVHCIVYNIRRTVYTVWCILYVIQWIQLPTCILPVTLTRGYLLARLINHRPRSFSPNG